MMVVLKNEVKKAFPLLDGIYSEERRILHNGSPVWIRQEGLREIQYLMRSVEYYFATSKAHLYGLFAYEACINARL